MRGSCLNNKRIVFVTTNLCWGGSEELWSRAAQHLANDGFSVGASIGFSPSHKRIRELAKHGIDIHSRPAQYPLLRRVLAKLSPGDKALIDVDIQRFLDAKQPALVVISDGLGLLRSAGILDLLFQKKMPFVTLSHLHAEIFWPDDELANRYRRTLASAHRCYFVSEANRRLFEKQLGCELLNAEIVCNPFNVDVNASPRWPRLGDNGVLRLANVARLEPLMKGQDILLEALADSAWRNRNWQLTFYGEGPMRNCIERMVQHFQLQDRVRFAGYVTSVEQIWAENHVLVMPSRYEGMPLAIVEAMLCARPVVATDVAGHAEIVKDGLTGFLADAPTASSVRSALDRMWERRLEIEAIGKAGARSIRKHVPPDPARSFADKISAFLPRSEFSRPGPNV
jgi:glycosyltransferase involved in cell wall biosynthesis